MAVYAPPGHNRSMVALLSGVGYGASEWERIHGGVGVWKGAATTAKAYPTSRWEERLSVCVGGRQNPQHKAGGRWGTRTGMPPSVR